MRYNYKGKQYTIELRSTGKIVCDDLSVSGDSVQEVQAAIRKHVDLEKSVKPVNVLTFGEGYSSQNKTEFFEGKVKPINVGNGHHYVQVWLSWKEGTRNNRAKVGLSGVYLDTPANRQIMNTVIDLNQQVRLLQAERDHLIEGLETLKLKGDDE